SIARSSISFPTTSITVFASRQYKLRPAKARKPWPRLPCFARFRLPSKIPESILRRAMLQDLVGLQKSASCCRESRTKGRPTGCAAPCRPRAAGRGTSAARIGRTVQIDRSQRRSAEHLCGCAKLRRNRCCTEPDRQRPSDQGRSERSAKRAEAGARDLQ